MALVGEWGFNEGSGTTADPEGTGATISGIPGWGAGHGGSASSMALDGNGPTFSAFSGNRSAFTIMLWVRLDRQRGVYQNLFYQPDGIFYLDIDETGTVDWWDGYDDVMGGTVTIGEWAHVAITADGSVRNVYHNGQLAGTLNSSTGTPTNNSLQWAVDPITALIDDLRIYDHALTQAEIATLMDTPIGGGAGPTPSGASVADLDVSATSAGSKVSAGDSDTAATATATGAGSKTARTGSTTGATVTAAGAGHRVDTRTGASVANITTASHGAGHKHATGQATVDAAATANGSGRKAAHGASRAPLMLTTVTGAGTKRAVGSAVASVHVDSTGAGRVVQSGQGATTANLRVAAVGAGVAYRHGHNTTTVHIQPHGTGTRPQDGRGGTVAPVHITTLSNGSKTTTGGTAAALHLAAIGDGHPVHPRRGASIATLTATSTNQGHKTTRSGTTAVLEVTTQGTGHNPNTGPVTFKLGPLHTTPHTINAPIGNPLHISPPQGHPLTISNLRRQPRG